MWSIHMACACQSHPLYPCWETVLDHNSSAAVKARQVHPAARHVHGADRLVPGVLSVVGVAYRTSGLRLEDRVDTLRAERVEARQRFLLPNFIQANGAVLLGAVDYTGVTVWAVFHYFPVCEESYLSFSVFGCSRVSMCSEMCDVRIRESTMSFPLGDAPPCVRKWSEY